MKKIIGLLIGVVLMNSFVFAEFIDVDNRHWGYEAVNKMAENKILSGYPDGSFRPSKNITLAEYASIFENFFNIEDNSEDNYFVNIDNMHWGKVKVEAIREYIQPNYDSISESLGIDKQAYEYGILADMPVTREVVIYSLNSILALDKDTYIVGDEKIFADSEKILYPEAAIILYKNGIISGEVKGDKLYLAPERYISRVEIASMFNKLLVNGNKITNLETKETFEKILKDIVNLMEEYKVDEVKEYIYDSANVLNDIHFNSLINNIEKNIIKKYFNKLEYNIVDFGFYSYNKAYLKIQKREYDYTQIISPLKNLTQKEPKDIVDEIVDIYGKQKIKSVETIKTINFIKNNNEWKIEL